ncbi:O-antigen ligase family protein [candidate division KSB1 bacterium]|nr:O-antigen ligase family protein [candidate division KSB1 bacterium]
MKIHATAFVVPAVLATAIIAAAALLYLPFKLVISLFVGLMGIALFMMTRHRRRLLLGLLVFVFPLNVDIYFIQQPSPGGADGLAVGLVDIFLFLLAMITLLRGINSNRARTLQFFPALLLPSIAILFFYLLSMLNAQDLLWSLFDTINLVKAILFYLIIANNIQTEKDVQVMLFALFFGMIVQAGIATAINIHPPVTEIFLRAKIGVAAEAKAGAAMGAFVRSGGSLGNANHLGRYFGLLLPLAYMIILVRQNRTLNLMAILAALCGTFAMISTLSRSAWLGLVFSLMIMSPLLFRYRVMSFRTLAVLGLSTMLGAFLLSLFANVIWMRLTHDDHGSLMSRFTTAQVAWAIIQDHPFFGCGINNYGAMLADYWIGEDTFTNKAAVHNNYLLYMAEIGLVGFTAVFWWLAAFGSRIFKAIKSVNPFFVAIAIGIFGGYAGMLLESLSDKSYKENFSLLLLIWAFMALIETIIRLNGEQKYDHRAITA